jgi:hypothetical protein
MPVVFVDAENVRRSTWPNIPRERVAELACAWAGAEGLDAVVVFDGPAPDVKGGARCSVVGTEAETADEWIIRAASRASDYWLVTSDRGLRAAAGGRAARAIGGGAFVRILTA